MPAHRSPVPLDRAYRLLNHGPTILVSAAHQGQRNLMAAAWAMPLDFEPPKVAVVLDKAVFTRELLLASGVFAVSVPCVAQRDIVQTVGNTAGKGLDDHGEDKFTRYGLATFTGQHPELPLLEGCVAWLECALVDQPANQEHFDLFIGEVTAAYADTRVFDNGRWDFRGQDALRTLHHVAGGHFLVIGDGVDGQMLDPRR